MQQTVMAQAYPRQAMMENCLKVSETAGTRVSHQAGRENVTQAHFKLIHIEVQETQGLTHSKQDKKAINKGEESLRQIR